MKTRQHTFRWFISTLLGLLFLTGCAPYSMKEVRLAFEEGNFEGALVHLNEGNSKGKATLPYLFERGLIAHYANRFDESNQAFEIAEITAEDLYTKSISREALSLLTSDNLRPYAGTRYERLLVHYYRALNYVYLNLPDEALVECRRAGKLIEYYSDNDEKYNFVGAAFLAYLSGILYEWTGDINDAYISYRWAETGYQRYEKELGVPFPEGLGNALVRLARMLGFDDEAQRYAVLYGEPSPAPPDSGELILIYESGFAPQKVEENLVLPILKTDSLNFEDESEEVWDFAGTVVQRQNLQYEEVDLEYLLRVAIPKYTSNRPLFSGVKVEVNNRKGHGSLVEDVEGAALTTFDSEQATILLRTTVRALLKYLGFRRANREAELLGRLINLVNIATEGADTRSWETLPNQIFIVRMTLPAGSHDVKLSFLDDSNRPIGTETLQRVEIYANGKTFLNHRTFY